jgi:ABC-type glutathione transport system ATPase component
MRADPATDTVLEARGLHRRHTRRGAERGADAVAALDGVDFRVRAGAFQALVGASGSGKSTLSRCLAGLEKPDAGVVLVAGCDQDSLSGPELRERRRAVQLIFQDPATSLNPRFRAWDAVSEPLAVRGQGRAERRDRAAALMEEVGLAA